MSFIKYNPFKTNGMSLLETLVALGIFSLVFGAVFVFIKQGLRVQDFSLEQTIAIQEARRGVETLVRELRETQIADDGAYPLLEATGGEIIFYSDFDKDVSVERVRYFLDGTDFKKGVIEPRSNPVEYADSDEVVEILSRYVRNGSDQVFQYYNSDWPMDTVTNPLATPANPAAVRQVGISLQINVKPAVAPADFILQSHVQIRNLKDNL